LNLTAHAETGKKSNHFARQRRFSPRNTRNDAKEEGKSFAREIREMKRKEEDLTRE
jgi:hypothetical protein